MAWNIYGYKYAHIEVHHFSSLAKHFWLKKKKWRGMEFGEDVPKENETPKLLCSEAAGLMQQRHAARLCPAMSPPWSVFPLPGYSTPSFLGPGVSPWCDAEARHEPPV